MPELRQELRLALRSLLRRPTFVAVTVATLALGIGANSAIFSVIDAVLLKPLPYRAPNDLVLIWSKWTNFDKTWVSDAEYQGYQQQTKLFKDVAAWDDNGEVALTGSEGTESVIALEMTANLLEVLGAPPALGRSFAPEEDVPNGASVVMIGYDLWRRRYGGASDVIGKTIVVDGAPQRIVGVMPRGFKFPLEFQARRAAQIFEPIRPVRGTPIRGNHGWYAVARLRPGVTLPVVNNELNKLTRGWTEQGLYPAAMKFDAFAIPVVQEVSGNVQLALIILAAAVGLLLLLTCANVANLILTRADSRQRELAVRSALGASRAELLRLSLIESVLLGLGGGATGLMFAWAGVRLLVARAPTTIPRLDVLGINWAVIGFTFVLSVATGVVFGMIPVLRGTNVDVAQALRQGSRGQSGSRDQKRSRTALVVAEMALAVLLVIGAGLTIRSFRNLQHVNAGFDAKGVLTLNLALPAAKYTDTASVLNFFNSVATQTRAMPGVTAAGFARLLPLATEMGDSYVDIEDFPLAAGSPGRGADWQAVSPGFLEAMKVRLVKGRFVDSTDTPDGRLVVLVNETLAREYFPGVDPVGRRIRFGTQRPWFTIIGVVGDYHHNGLLNPVKRAFFVPMSQWSSAYGRPRRSMTLAVRTTGDPQALIGPITRVVHQLDPDVPPTQIQTMGSVLADATQEQRFTMGLMAGFAVLALLLASVGIYGVVSYSVAERTREVGIRIALGAPIASVRTLVLRQGLAPAITGIGVGLALALASTRFLRNILYQVAPVDLFTFATIPVLLLGVAAGAVLIPAVRASRVNPVEALRGND